MSDKKKHAILSPSSAYRWMRCPGSIVLVKRYPGKTGAYAEEGTEAHGHAAHFLEHGKFEKELDREMSRNLRDYITYVQDEARGQHLMVEQVLPLTWLTGEEDAEGTSDCVIISEDGELLTVIDLKYGAGVKVYVHKNEQLMIYALTAYKQFQLMGDIQRVKMVIHQPRMDHVDDWEISIEELMEFAGDVKLAVAEVRKAEKSNSLDGFLYASEKACRFCPAAGNCPALAQLTVDETGMDFENVDQRELVAPADPHKALLKIPMLEIYAKGVRSAVEADLLAGRGSKFWALEEGKKGRRKWIDEKETEKEMKKLGLKGEEMYEPLCIYSPTQAEKVIKKKKPGVWEKVKELYKQPKGPPSVVAIRDLKEPYTPTTAEDFENVEE